MLSLCRPVILRPTLISYYYRHIFLVKSCSILVVQFQTKCLHLCVEISVDCKITLEWPLKKSIDYDHGIGMTQAKFNKQTHCVELLIGGLPVYTVLIDWSMSAYILC